MGGEGDVSGQLAPGRAALCVHACKRALRRHDRPLRHGDVARSTSLSIVSHHRYKQQTRAPQVRRLPPGTPGALHHAG